jgi:hypothetical protein
LKGEENDLVSTETRWYREIGPMTEHSDQDSKEEGDVEGSALGKSEEKRVD